MSKKQIQREEALRDIASIRDRLITLKEHMEPLPFGLANDIRIVLNLLRVFEDETRRHYRWNEDQP